MINKSLGQLHKVRVQGEAADGTETYASMESMWRNQFDLAEGAATEESKGQPANSKQKWYKGSVDYWNA